MDHCPERLPLAGMPGPGCRVRAQPPAAGEQRAQLRRCAAEVLRQTADEEWLLFSAYDAPPGLARLSRDHVRLRAKIDVLACSAADRGACAPVWAILCAAPVPWVTRR
jgi:hypothetical protein